MTPVIRTFTGKNVNPLMLRPEDIDIQDIAHHLACINRFCGAVRTPINVANHSVLVMRITHHFVDDPSIELQALLHDAPEAYLGDVTKWLKQSRDMLGYRIAEGEAHRRIMDRFQLPHQLHPTIVQADHIAVRFEGQLGFNDLQWPGVEGYGPLTNDEMLAIDNHYAFHDWMRSEEEFLYFYNKLTNWINANAIAESD